MEEQFYLVWPLALILMLTLKWSTRTIVGVVTALAVVSFVGWFAMPDMPYNPVLRASGLLVGCAVAFLVQTKPWHSRSAAYVAVAVIAASLVTEYLDWTPRSITVLVVVLAMPFVLLHTAFGSGPMIRFLSLPVLVYVGVLSYALYLWTTLS